MANSIRNQEAILAKLNIHQLNPMQEEAIASIKTYTNTILLSPTGTGKTLAFSLPLLDSLDPESKEIQALILVPSRELAIQIEQVIMPPLQTHLKEYWFYQVWRWLHSHL